MLDRGAERFANTSRSCLTRGAAWEALAVGSACRLTVKGGERQGGKNASNPGAFKVPLKVGEPDEADG